MEKIIIIGLTGTGKTTLANKLGNILNIPVHHLDKIFWRENWQASKQAEFIERQQRIIEDSDKWIMDGSFPRSKSLDLRISHADTIIFFDLPLVTVLWRMTKRFFKFFGKERPDVGSGNRQKWPFTWKDIKYGLDYPTKEIYEKILPLANTKNIVVIKNQKDTELFLQKVQDGSVIEFKI